MATAPTVWFDGRLRFNDEAFGKYVDALPATKTFRFMNSGIVVPSGNLVNLFSAQTGAFSQRVPIYGDAETTEENYDGVSEMGDPGYQDTYSRAVVAFGRQFALAEKDFSYDLIPGANFEAVLRKAIVNRKDTSFENRLFGVTNALFGAAAPDTDEGETASPEYEFAQKHTYDITSASSAAAKKIGDTTLNDALQQASGEFKSDFSLVAMHSQVATNLENKKLLEYAKGVDASGVTKDLSIYTWNGKTVIVDDAMPYDSTTGTYTTYVYGRGMFEYSDIGVKTPYEPVRDSKKAIDMMYIRYRQCLAPKGFSFEGAPATHSPTDTELFTAGNWKLADNGKTGEDRKVYPINRIPLVRIKSLG